MVAAGHARVGGTDGGAAVHLVSDETLLLVGEGAQRFPFASDLAAESATGELWAWMRLEAELTV